MGVKLKDLINGEKLRFEDLSGKKIAIDAFNALYQFLAIIRVGPGVPLKDSYGRITSHLNGLLYRTIRLLEYGIYPIYVFDGKPPVLKAETLEKRHERKVIAMKEFEEALKKGDYEKAWSKAVQTSRLSDSMANDAKELLDLMGVPWVQAPSEGEAQAAYMTVKGDVWAAASQDYDSLLFGAKRLVRNLTITGRRFYRKKKIAVKLEPELVELDTMLEKLKLTRGKLVDLAILVGTDYNEGIRGIGPKKAYKLILKYGSLDEIINNNVVQLNFDYNQVRRIFLKPEVTDSYDISWGKVDKEGLIQFLVDERSFSEKRVLKAIERLKKTELESKQQTLF